MPVPAKQNVAPIAQKRACERAYLLFSRGRSAEPYVRMLSRSRPQLLSAGQGKLASTLLSERRAG